VICTTAFGEEIGKRNRVIRENQNLQTPKGRETFNLGIRSAIYRDRARLLELIKDPVWKRTLCVPPPIRSYELFQQSLADDMEKLLDLEFNATTYGLSDEEVAAVLACRRSMERYIDNFQLWKELSSQQE
jgi:hypothetical protein